MLYRTHLAREFKIPVNDKTCSCKDQRNVHTQQLGASHTGNDHKLRLQFPANSDTTYSDPTQNVGRFETFL